MTDVTGRPDPDQESTRLTEPPPAGPPPAGNTAVVQEESRPQDETRQLDQARVSAVQSSDQGSAASELDQGPGTTLMELPAGGLPAPGSAPTLGSAPVPAAAPAPASTSAPALTPKAEQKAEQKAKRTAERQAKRMAKRKRSIPTPALYSVLAVIGLVVGAGAGYAAQYERKPTPLPALAAAQPTYPASAPYTGEEPSPLPVSQDDASIAEGNLLSVLLPTPSGATAVPGSDHVWLTLADEAANCVNQSACLSNELSEGVSRIAQTAWSVSGGEMAEITITEYTPGFSDKAATDFAQDETGGDGTFPLSPAGTGAQGYSVADSDDTGTTDYMVALHGNLLVEFLVWTTSAPAPDPTYINGLVTQQLARL